MRRRHMLTLLLLTALTCGVLSCSSGSDSSDTNPNLFTWSVCALNGQSLAGDCTETLALHMSDIAYGGHAVQAVRVTNMGTVDGTLAVGTTEGASVQLAAYRQRLGDDGEATGQLEPASLPMILEPETVGYITVAIANASPVGALPDTELSLTVSAPGQEDVSFTIPVTGAVSDCAKGRLNCNESADDGCEVDSLIDLNHCGACDTPCTVENGTAQCVDGACIIQCDEGFDSADCSQCAPGHVGTACLACPGLDESGTVCSGQGTCAADDNDEPVCTCVPAYQGAVCDQDVDECAAAPDPCDPNAQCANTDGSFTCTCDVGYEGDGFVCTDIDDCAANPCANGACTDAINDYSCTCNPGWDGKDCDQNIDECAPLPCANGACTDAVNDYSCTCDPGWAGMHCDLPVDECTPNPCANGNCVDAVNGYNCVCHPGWDGKTCDQNIDECAANPCVVGTCADAINDYTCTCSAGFEGKNCDKNTDDCAAQPCVNGACTDGLNDYSCTCDPGWEGKDCALPLDECANNPCINGACTDKVNDYSCTCVPGWAGKNCDINIDECATNPCLNGACIDAVNSYSCTCDPGWAGMHCDLTIDDCTPDPCTNGNCIDTVNGYSCACHPGWSGKDCDQNIDECANANCGNGVCVDGINETSCTCDPGWGGADCTIDVDECVAQPCVNGACSDTINDYSCTCDPGWSGKDCDNNNNECAANPCVNGTCTDAIANYTCTCVPGWDGKNCDINIDDCAAQPCVNGSCSDAINDYSCACTPGWSGKNCGQNIDDCAANPCANGTCADAINDYSCSCVAGWSGKNCDINIDECAGQPCVNGSCIDALNDYSCACDPGWTGKNCAQNIDECPNNPCVNGTCVDKIGTYACSCDLGWSGTICDISIDDCATNPCINGTCVDGLADYSCTCANGWTGKNCDLNQTDCPTPNPCLNGGICVDGDNSYTCTCAAGYTGTLCDLDIDECATNPCLNDGTCVDGINGFTCTCPLGFDGLTCETPAPCEIPLQVTPTSAIVGLNIPVILQVSGGQGPYQFQWINNGSNGLLHAATGYYITGPNGESTDIIQISDPFCQQSVQTTIQVVSPPELAMGDTFSMPPNLCIQLDILKGSGQFDVQLTTQPAALGTLDAQGLYTAGSTEGTESITIVDAITGDSTTVSIQINAAGGLQVEAPQLLMATGTTQALVINGGSGLHTTVLQGSAITLNNGTITALQPGTATITITDDEVGCSGPAQGPLTQPITVTVVDAMPLNAEAFGNDDSPVVALSPGDLNGDGYNDAIVANAATSYGGYQTGAVYVYGSSAAGMDPTPAQVISTNVMHGEFATAIAVGDVTGDGEPDLAVGAPQHHGGGYQWGSVYIYRGLTNGFFEPTPSALIDSYNDNDRLGDAVAICDVNDDGFQDLIATAIEAESSNQANNQGTLQVFFGSANGLSTTADQEVFGVAPTTEGSPLTPKMNHRLGRAMTTGDYDGDGVCDLLVTGGYGNSNWAFLYPGTSGQGISTAPMRHWGPFRGLGRNPLLRDLDNDLRADVIIPVAEDNTDAWAGGAVYVFRGQAMPQIADWSFHPPATADWAVTGKQSSRNLGQSIAVDDVNGDGWVDLLVHLPINSNSGLYQPGTFQIYRGQPQGMFESQPWKTVGGVTILSQFGSAMTSLGDLNGDGFSELVVVARNSDVNGPGLGQTYQIQLVDDPVIPLGDTWKYNVDGVDLGTAWLDVNYDDSAWASGPAPFGKDDDPAVEATFATILPIQGAQAPTAYFRKTINLPNGATWFDLTAVHFAGLAVWVNGQLVHTQNLDGTPNALDFGAYANGWNHGSPSSYTLDSGDPNPFVVGDNVVSVMVKAVTQWTNFRNFNLRLYTSAGIDPAFGTHMPIETPFKIAGNRFGNTVSVVGDVNGDGFSDLLIGAPNAALNGRQQSGRAELVLGTATGFESTAALTFGDLILQQTYATFGDVVKGSGDFDGDGISDMAIVSYQLGHPWNGIPPGLGAPSECQQQQNNLGGVFVIRGVSTGLPANEPAFVIYGPQPGQNIDAAATGFDYDGDGIHDLAITGDWNAPNGGGNRGGVALYRGRAATGSTQVICSPDTLVFGPTSNTNWGAAVTGLGDLDNDGCDELVISDPSASTPNATNAGSVTVLYGSGANCGAPTPRVATLYSDRPDAHIGAQLAAGMDLDNDGLSELAIAAPDLEENGLQLGAVFLIGGQALADVPTTTLSAAANTSGGEALPSPIAYPAMQAGILKGTVPGSNWNPLQQTRFGSAIAWMPPTSTTAASLVIGSPRGERSGIPGSGNAEVYEFDMASATSGWPFRRVATFSGESHRPEGRLGQSVDAVVVGEQRIIIVGGPNGTPANQSERVQDGSIYVLPLATQP